jgi:hypothetical protein
MDTIKESNRKLRFYYAFLLKKHIEKQDLNMRDYFLLEVSFCQKNAFNFKRELNLKQAKEIVSVRSKFKQR